MGVRRQERKSSESLPGHEFPDGQHGDLHENGGNDERLSTVREESVKEYEEDTGGQAQEPCTEGHHRDGGVVGLRHHKSHLLHRTTILAGVGGVVSVRLLDFGGLCRH